MFNFRLTNPLAILGDKSGSEVVKNNNNRREGDFTDHHKMAKMSNNRVMQKISQILSNKQLRPSLPLDSHSHKGNDK